MKKIKIFVEEKVKRILRKWLKKRVYRQGIGFDFNKQRFDWVYNAPLHEWRDRIWCLENDEMINQPDLLLKLYLYQ